MGKEEADVTKLFGKTLYTHRINCQAIPGCYKFGEVGGVHTLMGSDAKLAIMPLMCAWMKYGGSLEVPKTGWIFVDGKGLSACLLAAEAIVHFLSVYAPQSRCASKYVGCCCVMLDQGTRISRTHC